MSGPIIDPFCASEENTKPECLTWRTKCLYAHLPRPGADEFFSPDSGAFVPPASSRLQSLEALDPIKYLPTYSILGPALSPASHTCTSPAFSQGSGDLLSIRNLPPAGSLISGVRGLCAPILPQLQYFCLLVPFIYSSMFIAGMISMILNIHAASGCHIYLLSSKPHLPFRNDF